MDVNLLRRVAVALNAILLVVSLVVMVHGEAGVGVLTEMFFALLLIAVPLVSIFALLWPDQRKDL